MDLGSLDNENLLLFCLHVFMLGVRGGGWGITKDIIIGSQILPISFYAVFLYYFCYEEVI